MSWFIPTALRKVTDKYRNVEGKLERRDIIKEYSNFDSQVYAPMTRIGVYLDSGSEQYNIKSMFTTSIQGEEEEQPIAKSCVIVLSHLVGCCDFILQAFWSLRTPSPPGSLNHGTYRQTTLMQLNNVQYISQNYEFPWSRVKAPSRSAKAVGMKARQKVKLSQILEQVHTDLVTERTKGETIIHKLILTRYVCSLLYKMNMTLIIIQRRFDRVCW